MTKQIDDGGAVTWLLSELRQCADGWMNAKRGTYPEAVADELARNDCGNRLDDILTEYCARAAANGDEK